MTYFEIFTTFQNIKTEQKAILKDTSGLDYQLSVLNSDGNKSRNRWISHSKLETEWEIISNEEYWQ